MTKKTILDASGFHLSNFMPLLTIVVIVYFAWGYISNLQDELKQEHQRSEALENTANRIAEDFYNFRDELKKAKKTGWKNGKNTING